LISSNTSIHRTIERFKIDSQKRIANRGEATRYGFIPLVALPDGLLVACPQNNRDDCKADLTGEIQAAFREMSIVCFPGHHTWTLQ
jgi:hypothetical protein